MNMFCYQCEQTAKGTGCTAFGACGKDPETAALQDLLIYALKDISRYAHRARELSATDKAVNVFTVKALFSTLTNVDFDPRRFQQLLKEAVEMKQKAQKLYENACKKAGAKPEEFDCDIKWWQDSDDLNSMIDKGESASIQKRIDDLGEDVAGLQELIVYGIKGAASYADHAQILGKEDDAVYAFIHKTLARLTQRPTDTDELLKTALDTGAMPLIPAPMAILSRPRCELPPSRVNVSSCRVMI